MAITNSDLEIPIRSVQAQLSDPRFSPIGRSGSWTLSEWINVERNTLIDLIKNFFEVKNSKATVDEITTYVISKRPIASENSIKLLLDLKKDIFIRVTSSEYELSKWGSNPYMRIVTRIKPHRGNIREKVQTEIRKYLIEAPGKRETLANVCEHVMKVTKCLRPTFYRYLSDMKDVKKRETFQGVECLLIN